MAVSETSRSSAGLFDPSGNPGPYVAVVRNHLDSKYMGSLEVEVLFSSGSGNSPNVPGRLAQVRYLSPFYGVTSFQGLTNNQGFKYTQKSYGMWMVPPDVGTRVLVIFAEGNRGQGFWIGCVQDDYMNFMIPAVTPATTYNEQDTETKLPVGEYNKKREKAVGRDPTKFLKPVNTDALDILDEQGLSYDETRGLTTSSARREVPSTVFGVSTPGPQDRRAGSPGIRYGENFAQSNTAFNRLGGSSIVMDDGDATLLRKKHASEGPPEYINKEAGEKGGEPTIPHNEMIKIKTRTGHQILMHNSEDLIYIGNAKGTTWIELTSNGKIDIFAQDSISIHTKQDLNFKADRDINFEAGRDINLKANTDVNFESVQDITLYAGRDNVITTKRHVELNTDGNNNLTAGGDTNILTSGNHLETAAEIHMNGPEALDAAFTVPFDTFIVPGEENEVIMKRVPQHEPWIHHENLDPKLFIPDETDIRVLESITEPELFEISDTFRKSVTRDVGSEPAVAHPAAPTPAAAKTEETKTGVIKSKGEEAAASTPPAEVTAATEAVKTDLTPSNVSALDKAIDTAVNAGKMGFAAAQTTIKSLDSAFSPSSLKAVVDAGVAVYDKVKVAASEGLLKVRSKLAKINTSNATTGKVWDDNLGDYI